MFLFLKKNSHTVTKLILNQFGAAILGIMLSLASMKSTTLSILFSAFAVCFYLYLQYTVVWEAGAKDRIRVDGGRMKGRPAGGFYLALWANMPNLLLGFITFLTALVFALTQVEWVGNIWYVTRIIANFWEAMYIGFVTNAPQDMSAMQAAYYQLVYLAIVIPSLVVNALGYYLGYTNHKIFPSLKEKENN